jgi:hypothetical protein
MKTGLPTIPLSTGFSLLYECCFISFKGKDMKLYGFGNKDVSIPIFKEIHSAIESGNTANTVKFGNIDIPYTTESTKDAILSAINFTAKYAPVRIQL